MKQKLNQKQKMDKCDTIEKQVDYLRKDVDAFKAAYIKNGKISI